MSIPPPLSCMDLISYPHCLLELRWAIPRWWQWPCKQYQPSTPASVLIGGQPERHLSYSACTLYWARDMTNMWCDVTNQGWTLWQGYKCDQHYVGHTCFLVTVVALVTGIFPGSHKIVTRLFSNIISRWQMWLDLPILSQCQLSGDRMLDLDIVDIICPGQFLN